MSAGNKIFVDFDGTIVDVFDRYLQILNEFLVSECLAPITDRDRYIELKKSRVRDHEITSRLIGQTLGFDIERYSMHKRDRLESEDLLRLDHLIGDPFRTYDKLSEAGFKVLIVSKRRNLQRLREQIGSFDGRICDEVLCVFPEDGKNVKYEALKELCRDGDYIIGDSPEDMEAGRMLGIGACFVRTGLWDIADEFVDVPSFSNYDSAADWICTQCNALSAHFERTGEEK